jgi:hypothetical protein
MSRTSNLLRYELIPPHTRESLQSWARDGQVGGRFLMAVLRNDLAGAVAQADEETMGAIPAIVAYCYNELPSTCWGTPERVCRWRGRHAVQDQQECRVP